MYFLYSHDCRDINQMTETRSAKSMTLNLDGDLDCSGNRKWKVGRRRTSG